MSVKLPPEITNMQQVIDNTEEKFMDLQTMIMLSKILNECPKHIKSKFHNDVYEQCNDTVQAFIYQYQEELSISIFRIIGLLPKEIKNMDLTKYNVCLEGNV